MLIFAVFIFGIESFIENFMEFIFTIGRFGYDGNNYEQIHVKVTSLFN